MSEDDERPSFGGGLGFGGPGGIGMAGRFNEQEDKQEDPGQPRKRVKIGNRSLHSRKNFSNESADVGKMTFAQRQMAKMGWIEGQGLGAEGKGRLNPIEVVQRPSGAGVGAVREKTKQAREEEKRAAAFRGEILEDDSEEERKRKKKTREARHAVSGGRNPTLKSSSSTWRPKYVNMEDLQADLQGSGVPQSLMEFAIDLSGKKISSAPSQFEPAQGIIGVETESNKAAKRIHRELISCAESKHGLNEQKANLSYLETHLIEIIDERSEEIKVVEECLRKLNHLKEIPIDGSDDSLHATWDDITTTLETLNADGKEHHDLLDYQEVAVAAIHFLFRRSVNNWKPLANPKFMIDYLTRLQPILTHRSQTGAGYKPDLDNGNTNSPKHHAGPYGSMMYNIWLHHVSSTIRDEFDVERPDELIRFVKLWRPLLPEFVYSHLICSDVAPRIKKAVREWKPHRNGKRPSLNPDDWIFPWLELFPAHLIDVNDTRSVISDAKTRLRKVLDTHPLTEGIPQYLLPWKDIMGSSIEKMATQHLLPRLSAYISQRFTIDPLNQDTRALNTVLLYGSLFRETTMAALLVTGFFPKFHDVLHKWLVYSSTNYGEVGEWWTWWKSLIPSNIRRHPILEPQWTQALTHIGTALDLGDRVAKELTPPTVNRSLTEPSLHDAGGHEVPRHKSSSKPFPPDMQTESTTLAYEPTFRDVVTDWCAEHNLLCLPIRDHHAGAGEQVLRITASVDQRRGMIAYIRGDVLRIRQKNDNLPWRLIELGDELEKLALGQ